MISHGFCGLAAVNELGQRSIESPYSNTDDSGGLAAGGWLEKFSPHWFTNNGHVVRLASYQGRLAARVTPFGLKVDQSGPLTPSSGSGGGQPPPEDAVLADDVIAAPAPPITVDLV